MPRGRPTGAGSHSLSDRPGSLKDSPAGKRQLYIMPADGGDAQQITKFEDGVESFEWAPDAKHIAIAAQGPEPKPMKDRKESFGDYKVIHGDYQMAHLWLIDVPIPDEAGRIPKAAEPKLLTKGDDYSVSDGFSFSPDGARIAFSAQRDPDLISSFSADVYVVNVADGAVKKIVDTAGPDENPKWSPDGKQIAYQTSGGNKYFFYTNGHIAVVASEGGTPQVLTAAAFDEDSGPAALDPRGHLLLGATEDHVVAVRSRSGGQDDQTNRDAGNFDRERFLPQRRFQAGGVPRGRAESIR